jgi:hypothetical protein
VTYKEQDGFVCISLPDFVRYLTLRQQTPALVEDAEEPITYIDANSKTHTIQAKDVYDVVFYMVDVDMPKLLPMMDKEYKDRFKIKEMLPGGAWCMMNSVRAGNGFISFSGRFI